MLYASFARATWAPDYDWAWSAEHRDREMGQLIEHWGEGLVASAVAPSMRDEPGFMEWAGRLERLAASPGTIRRIFDLIGAFDVRDVLPSIRVPTLVMHRDRDTFIKVDHSRYMASKIPGARYVELEGEDNMFSIGDSEALIGEIEEFLTGTRHEREPDRMLATVLFTDICDSTSRAAEMGDRGWRFLLERHDALFRQRARPPPRPGGEAHRRRLPRHLRRARAGDSLRGLRGGGDGLARAPDPGGAPHG